MKGEAMDFLIVLWIVMGLGTGLAIGFMEGRVNHQPPRYKNCLLWTLLLGPIGFVVILLRSCLTYAGGSRRDQKVIAQAAAEQLARNRDQGQ
jgi:hypothetical protein